MADGAFEAGAVVGCALLDAVADAVGVGAWLVQLADGVAPLSFAWPDVLALALAL